MNNYIINCTSQTVSCFAVSIIATALAVNCNVTTINKTDKLDINLTGYSKLASPSTFDSFSNMFTGQFTTSYDVLVETVSNLYTHLLAAQEPLGYEFAKVLHENIWDLYES